jgi:5-bromo-4-chloroindolyl phosphate hydrolysis protein
MKNISISIDDLIGTVANAKRNLLSSAQEARKKVREVSNTDAKYLWSHLAEAHEQNAQKIDPLIKKLNDIHELGYGSIGGVGEREVV